MLSKVRLPQSFCGPEGPFSAFSPFFLTIILLADLIRKPVNHGPRSDDVKVLDSHNAQPAVAHSRAPRQQEQAQSQPPNGSSITENPQPQQPMRSPPAHQLAQSWVDGEREAKSKMPTYKGLEEFKLLEKMGE